MAKDIIIIETDERSDMFFRIQIGFMKCFNRKYTKAVNSEDLSLTTEVLDAWLLRMMHIYNEMLNKFFDTYSLRAYGINNNGDRYLFEYSKDSFLYSSFRSFKEDVKTPCF